MQCFFIFWLILKKLASALAMRVKRLRLLKLRKTLKKTPKRSSLDNKKPTAIFMRNGTFGLKYRMYDHIFHPESSPFVINQEKGKFNGQKISTTFSLY